MSRFVWMTVGGVPRVVDLFRARPVFPHLDVKDFGAAGDGVTDDQGALEAAVAEAAAQGLPLYLPTGHYAHSGILTLDGVTLFGLSRTAVVLRGLTQYAHALVLTGSGPGLHNITIDGTAREPRSALPSSNGVSVDTATGFTVRNCAIRRVGGAGIMVTDGHAGVIRNNRVEATGADGILIAEGSDGIEIAFNLTVETGDDAIAVTSYDSALGYTSDVEVHHNTVLANWQSRAVTVNGTSGGVVIHDNYIDGGTSGVSVTAVAEWNTLQNSGVQIYGNTIRNVNQARQDTGTIGGGALSLWNDVGGSDSGISFHDNRIYNPNLHGIYAGGSAPITAAVTGNAFYLAPGLTLSASDNPSASITETGTVSAGRSAYPGDLVARSVGGPSTAYRFRPEGGP